MHWCTFLNSTPPFHQSQYNLGFLVYFLFTSMV
nr:MAG TPA: hypothetical protein [Caudoviricetes sp.]